jgi:predicted nuclease of predicted toxin-antitoxin system
MRFKLDENLDPRLASWLSEGGHNVETVLGEGLSGRNDEAIYAACRSERRTLITLDLDFSNPFRFPPGSTEGIIVLRPSLPLLPLIRATLRGSLAHITSGRVQGRLWIVELGRIREHDPADTHRDSEG